MAKITITGGSGLVGSRLTEMLSARGDEVIVLSRSSRPSSEKVSVMQWSVPEGRIEDGALDADHIIHLAGAGVADKRWTSSRKKEIRDSRVLSSQLLAREIVNYPRVKSVIGASAVGYYGSRNDTWLQEDAAPGEGFLSDICVEWEDETSRIGEAAGIPVSLMRIGIVLSTKGGALPKLAQPVKFGIGAYLGDGGQYYPWIHIDDLCKMFIHAMDNRLEGPFNAAAPDPATNKDLAKTIAHVLKKPFIPAPGPAFILRTVMGEMATMLLNSQRTSAEAITSTGFSFDHPQLDKALRDIFLRKV